MLRALDSADKALALAASSDALTYQAIRAVEPSGPYPDVAAYDPSDEGEIARIARRRGELNDDQEEEPLDGLTESALADFFGGD